MFRKQNGPKKKNFTASFLTFNQGELLQERGGGDKDNLNIILGCLCISGGAVSVIISGISSGLFPF